MIKFSNLFVNRRFVVVIPERYRKKGITYSIENFFVSKEYKNLHIIFSHTHELEYLNNKIRKSGSELTQ
jgi:hypothetical protein